MEQPAELDDEIAELFPYDVLSFNRDIQLPVVIRDATVSENFTRLFFSARQYDETASRWAVMRTSRIRQSVMSSRTIRLSSTSGKIHKTFWAL
jgi:hypothetical protein